MRNDPAISKGALTLYQRYLIKKKNDGELLSLYDFGIIALEENSVDSEKFQNLMNDNPNLGPNFLKKLDLKGLDLSKANLSGLDLSGANLSGANLSGANLTWADLTEANLNGADFSLADLTGAKLNGAKLNGANLIVANLRLANLTGAKVANVIQASINEETITIPSQDETIPISSQFYEFLNVLDKTQRKEILGTDDTSAINYLQNLLNRFTANSYSQQYKTEINRVLDLVKSVCLNESDLNGLNFFGADLSWADLSWADLSGLDLCSIDLNGKNLARADLTGSNLTRVKLNGVNLTGANLTGAKLNGADLTGANLNGAYLTGADLTGAKVANVIQASINEETIPIPPQFYEFLNALDKAQRKEILGTGDTSASKYLQDLKNNKLTGDSFKITQIDKLLNVVESFEKELKGEIESHLSPNPQNPRQSRLERTFGEKGCNIS